MESLFRAAGCICSSRSWRTARSCLHFPRLVLALLVIHLLHSSQSAKYSHDTGTYYTFSCNDSWCGERWGSNRILRYGYNYTDKLVLQHNVHRIHDNNCTGAQDSRNCNSSTIVRNETRPTRVRVIQRLPEPEITEMPNLNLYLITTDNINESSSISDTYEPNHDKIWQIRIPRGCKMTVYFSQFDLEVSERCTKDSFSVQTSKEDPEIHRYCNDLHKIEIKRKRRVQMTFHSDPTVQRGGIRATVCLSDQHDAVTEDDLNQRFPCSCTEKPARRRKKSSPLGFAGSGSSLRERIAEEDIKVATWLDALMQGGQEVLNEYLRNPESPKQRHLAEQYQEALSKHRVW